jgi:hypothetical protein
MTKSKPSVKSAKSTARVISRLLLAAGFTKKGKHIFSEGFWVDSRDQEVNVFYSAPDRTEKTRERCLVIRDSILSKLRELGYEVVDNGTVLCEGR